MVFIDGRTETSDSERDTTNVSGRLGDVKSKSKRIGNDQNETDNSHRKGRDTSGRKNSDRECREVGGISRQLKELREFQLAQLDSNEKYLKELLKQNQENKRLVLELIADLENQINSLNLANEPA